MNLATLQAVFDEKSIWDYLAMGLRRWKLVVFVLLLGVVAALASTVFGTTLYRTQAVLSPSKIERSSGWYPVQMVSDPKLQLDSFVGEVSMEIVMELLRSRDTRRLVIEQLDLASHYGYGASSMALACKRLDAMTSVQLGLDGQVLYLLVQDTSPEMSARIAQAFIENLSRRNEQLQLTSDSSIVRVLDSPFVPDSRFRPSLKLNGIIALMVATVLSALLVLALEVRSIARHTTTRSAGPETCVS